MTSRARVYGNWRGLVGGALDDFVGADLRHVAGATAMSFEQILPKARGAPLCHIRLRCHVVAELKVKRFGPGFAGRLNFCVNAVDKPIRVP